MQTRPHWTIVGPISDVNKPALPSAPWLSTTAGNGPAPNGLRSTPVKSYLTPSTVPRKVHVAPVALSGFPVTTKPVSLSVVSEDGAPLPPQPASVRAPASAKTAGNERRLIDPLVCLTTKDARPHDGWFTAECRSPRYQFGTSSVHSDDTFDE